MSDLRTTLRAADPHPDPPAYDDLAAARLLERVTSSREMINGPLPTVRRKRHAVRTRLAVGAGLSTVAVATAIGVTAWSIPVASAGIELTREGDYYLVHITEPERDSTELTAALQAKGLDITLSAAPASPSVVGSIVAMGLDEGTAAIAPLHAPPCLASLGCEVGLRVPVDFAGSADVMVGRPAAAGEAYLTTGSSVDPGERFACQVFRGRPVPDVVAEIEATGVAVEYRGVTGDSQDPAAYAHLIVNDIAPQSATEVLVFAQEPPFLDPVLPETCPA